MNPNFWLSVAFLISLTGLFEAALQCQTAEYSIGGMSLRGHTFKTCKIEWNESCYFRCAEDVRCQSYNFVIGHNVCELNNRTREARPEDFIPDQTRFYMKRSKNRGILHLFVLVCLFFTMQPFSMLACVLSGDFPASTLFWRPDPSNVCWCLQSYRENG